MRIDSFRLDGDFLEQLIDDSLIVFLREKMPYVLSHNRTYILYLLQRVLCSVDDRLKAIECLCQ